MTKLNFQRYTEIYITIQLIKNKNPSRINIKRSFVFDLPSATNFMTRLHADDTCLILSREIIECLHCEANIKLNKVIKWMNENKLCTNFTKTKYVLFEPPTNKLCNKFYFNTKKTSIKIENVDNVKYLAIIYGKKLTCTKRIQYINNKLSKAQEVIRKSLNLCMAKNTSHPLFLLSTGVGKLRPTRAFCATR